MGNVKKTGEDRLSIFLNERFMAATCLLVVITGLGSLYFSVTGRDGFGVFSVVTKLVTGLAMYLAFKFYKWDVAKGLMGGVLFSVMYQEAYQVLDRLWAEQDFDTYLVVGVQGSLYLAAAGMALLMTAIITINHFFINYAAHGNPKNVILNRMAIIVKFAVYVLLFTCNGLLGFAPAVLWQNALQYLSDLVLLLLALTVESQFDSFKALRQELLQAKRKGGRAQ